MIPTNAWRFAPPLHLSSLLIILLGSAAAQALDGFDPAGSGPGYPVSANGEGNEKPCPTVGDFSNDFGTKSQFDNPTNPNKE